MERALKIAARVAGALVILVFLIVAVGVWKYFSWGAQGDETAFSPTGGLGWGTRPYFMHGPDKAQHQVGIVQSYLFIAHAHLDNDVKDDLTPAKQ